MNSEIVFCSKCRSEYELMYKDDEVVTQTYCKCPRLSDKERLNKAIKELELKFNIKSKEVKNEESVSKN